MHIFPSQAGGIAVVAFETIGSTNAEALARVQAGERGPLFVVAERQSAGRGRRGRTWESELGNLYASLLVVDPVTPAASPQICFVAVLALHDAVLDACAGLAPARLRLKWPNDLLLDQAKVSGILVEGTTLADGKLAAAIGIGVNCRHHPADTPYPANDFAAAGFDLSPAALLARLGERWSERAREWNRGEGFAAIRAAWLLRATGIGSAIEVRLPDRTLAGTFEAIDKEGALLLRKADGAREAISAGDVFPIASTG
jgi:BirA family transcriptional regulator, biotin operon repressor / biotin---[acetyl-CoA-carboxylase] ligase